MFVNEDSRENTKAYGLIMLAEPSSMIQQRLHESAFIPTSGILAENSSRDMFTIPLALTYAHFRSNCIMVTVSWNPYSPDHIS